jgi:hypothetical protein
MHHFLVALLVLLTACVQPIAPTPTPTVPPYQYALCHGAWLWAYDGSQGYVRWGRSTSGGHIDYALPLVGKARLLTLTACRVMVRDHANYVLYLDFDGKSWSLPYVGYSVYLPLMGRMEDAQ